MYLLERNCTNHNNTYKGVLYTEFMGDLNSAYQRNDTFENGDRKTSYYSDNTIYDTLEQIADHVTRVMRFENIRTVSIYRATMQSLVGKKQDDYLELLQDCPAIHITRENSRVVKASGDSDDLLKLQGIIEKMRASGR